MQAIENVNVGASVVEESISDGDWTDYYDELLAEIIRQWNEE